MKYNTASGMNQVQLQLFMQMIVFMRFATLCHLQRLYWTIILLLRSM